MFKTRMLLDKLKVFVLVIILLTGCRPQSEGVKNKVFVDPVFMNSDGTRSVSLVFDFKSDVDLSFMFDYDALTLESYHREPNDSIEMVDDINREANRLEHPQFIIENKDGKKRLFYDAIFFDDEIYKPKEVFKLEQTLDTVRLAKNQGATIRTEFINVNRHKILAQDSMVRIYYIYKATREEKKSGFDDVIFESNWINLYQ